jgi:hypothetical protein
MMDNAVAAIAQGVSGELAILVQEVASFIQIAANAQIRQRVLHESVVTPFIERRAVLNEREVQIAGIVEDCATTGNAANQRHAEALQDLG